MPGSVSAFLKKDEFLPESDKPLLLSYLHKWRTVFTVIAHEAKNLSEAITIASKSFRHTPGNHTSSAKNYTIVNYWKEDNMGALQ